MPRQDDGDRRDRDRRRRPNGWAPLLGLILAAEAAPAALGQEPICPPGTVPRQVRGPGPIRRAIGGFGRAVHEDFIGDPDLFVEAPVGTSVRETYATMRAKASPHRFTLYRSDFLADSTALSPAGYDRMARMGACLNGWLGPVVVEWTPDRPGLSEARREAVLAAFNGSGRPVGAERVVIGPAAATGLMGTDAANNYQILINRDQSAPAAYSLSPAYAATIGGGGR